MSDREEKERTKIKKFHFTTIPLILFQFPPLQFTHKNNSSLSSTLALLCSNDKPKITPVSLQSSLISRSFFASQSSAATPATKQQSTEPKRPPKPASSTSTLLSTLIPAEGGIPYAKVADLFARIEGTTKRLAINEYLTTFFRELITLHPQSLLPTIYLSINRLGPAYEGIELGLGEGLLVKAIAAATGRTAEKIRAAIAQKGDLGLVAESSKNTQSTLFKPKALAVCDLFWLLRDIATMTGKDSMQRKMDKVKLLLVACQGNEAKYLVRSLEGKLRIGLAEASVLVSLAQAFHKPGELDVSEAVEKVKAVFHELPDYNIVVPALFANGIEHLEEHCQLTAGVPLKPMLAHPTKSISEVLNRFEGVPFTCEYKYDGERAQIHLLPTGEVMVFSRNCENMTEKYPDVVESISKFIAPGITSFVVDCEAVAWDLQAKKILPFQVLTTRKRKDVKSEDVTVKVCLFAFDLLFLQGKSLLKQEFAQRRKLLHSTFIPTAGTFEFARSMDSSTVEEIGAFLEEAIAGNCEGLMVKTLHQDSSYEPSRRSRKWLKVKKDYIDGIGDSLDLTVIGGYTGKGKRTGTFGGYLLACYDAEQEEFQAICKIGTGFSDADLAEQFKFFSTKAIAQPKPYYKVSEAIKPDVWFEPAQVWEVKAADFSLSPIYPAAVGLVDEGKGISLRFPRFVRVREDKSAENSTSSRQVAQLYRNQSSQQGGAGPGEDSDDLDY